jgi:predicted transcriptional regulator
VSRRAVERTPVDGENNRVQLAVLTKIANLLALLVTKDDKQEDRIVKLNAAGYTPSEIANLIGTTPNTVRVTLSTSKTRAKSRTK